MQLEVASTTSIPIEPGFSGAPVWDKDDSGVVGMIVEVEKREGIRVAFAIPTEILIQAWPELNDYIHNDLSSIAEELERYLQRLRETLSWLPGYYPQGFSFDHIRQRIKMKQQTFEDETRDHEGASLVQGSIMENDTEVKAEEQAYTTRTDDTTQSDTTVTDWDTIRAEGARAVLPSTSGKKAKEQAQSVIVDWETIRNEVKRVVLLGDPGSGKSWLLKYEGRVIAREQMEKLQQRQLRQDEVIFPIFLRLGSFAEEITIGYSNSIDLIVNFLKQEYELSEQFLLYVRRWLIGTQCLLLLDALDEVAEDRRTRMREALRQLSEQSDCRILLTSRIVGYRGVPFTQKESKWKQELELVAFAQEQIENFVGCWFINRIEYGQHLLDTLHAEPPLRLLVGIPLLLSFLCLATSLCDTIPTRRAELYETVLRLLLEASWRNEIQDRSLALRVEEKQDLLEAVAWYFARLDGRWHDIMVAEELKKAVEKWAQAHPGDDDRLSHAILEELIEKDAMLVRIGASQRRKQKEKLPYLFLHRTFHEYLVARYLANLPVDEYLQLIRPHFWFDTDWEVVLLLLAGCLDDPNPLLKALLNEPHDIFHTMLLLAGRCLAEANKLFVEPEVKDTIIERLISFLYSSAERDRAQVIPILAKMGEAVIDKLLPVLEDKVYKVPIYSVSVRVAAAVVLGQINHSRVVPSLTNVLQNVQDCDIAIYEATANALGHINSLQSAQVLIDALASGISGIRKTALEDALGGMHNIAIIEMLKRDLLQLDLEGKFKLIPENKIRSITRKLSKIDDAQSTDALLGVLHDSYKTYENLLSLRRFIAGHLSLIKDSKRKDLLVSLLKEEPTIYRAIRGVEEPVVDEWLELIQSIGNGKYDVHLRWEMAWSVQQIDDEVADALLEAVWSNPVQYQLMLSVQEMAAWALGYNKGLESDKRISALKALGTMYDDEWIDTVITLSQTYLDPSSGEGLLAALQNIGESELKRYLSCIQLWVLVQIFIEVQKTKQTEDIARFLVRNIVNVLGVTSERKVVSLLVDMLRFEHKEPWDDILQLDLIRALGRSGDSRAIEILLAILRECIYEHEWTNLKWFVMVDKKTRSVNNLINAISGTVGKIGGSQIVEPLLTILQKTDNGTYEWYLSIWSPIVDVLSQIGDPQAIEFLLSTIYDGIKQWIRRESAQALGNIGDTRAVDILVANLSVNSFRKIFSLAVEHLSKNNVKGSPLWRSLLKYREWHRMTEDALITMGKQGNPVVVDALLRAVQKQKWRMRYIKKAVFGRSPNRRDIALLMHTLLNNEEDVRLRRRIAELVGRIGNIQVVEGLLVCLQEGDWEIRRNVMSAVEMLATKCDPGLFCKRLLSAEKSLVLEEDSRSFIYDLLAQQSPRLRDVTGKGWKRWRVRLMQSTNYMHGQLRISMFILNWQTKIMAAYSSLQRVQKEVPQQQQSKSVIPDASFPTENIHFVETFFALIGLKEITVGWLCYFFGWVTGLFFFLVWGRNRFVRFHAIQSILLFFPINVVLILLYHYSVPDVLLKIATLFIFACWILLMALAREGEYCKLPMIGMIAKKIADINVH